MGAQRLASYPRIAVDESNEDAMTPWDAPDKRETPEPSRLPLTAPWPGPFTILFWSEADWAKLHPEDRPAGASYFPPARVWVLAEFPRWPFST